MVNNGECRTLVKKGIILATLIGASMTAYAVMPKHNWGIAWQTINASFVNDLQAQTSDVEVSPWNSEVISAAESQIGVTVRYDSAYAGLDFPNGDIPRERGVCSDVLIRALRDAHEIDLQLLVNKDMKAAFSKYPTTWGLSKPDRNIDHRRVLNLRVYFDRKGASVPISNNPEDYLPGDIVTWMLPGNLPHIGIVTNRLSRDGERPMIVHNIGAGTRLQDMLFEYDITGHYRPENISQW